MFDPPSILPPDAGRLRRLDDALAQMRAWQALREAAPLAGLADGPAARSAQIYWIKSQAALGLGEAGALDDPLLDWIAAQGPAIDERLRLALDAALRAAERRALRRAARFLESSARERA